MEDGYIKLSACEEDGCMLLSVTDNGCGIPPDILEILNSNNKKIPGEHLGLFNVDSIIRLHYGEAYGLSAQSAPGLGSCISLRLPMQKEN